MEIDRRPKKVWEIDNVIAKEAKQGEVSYFIMD